MYCKIFTIFLKKEFKIGKKLIFEKDISIFEEDLNPKFIFFKFNPILGF